MGNGGEWIMWKWTTGCAALAIVSIAGVYGAMHWVQIKWHSELSRVASTMFDPDSVRFEELRQNTVGGVAYLCGGVNAKNRYGAYVGSRLFVMTKGWQEPVISDGEPATTIDFLRDKWSVYCVK